MNRRTFFLAGLSGLSGCRQVRARRLYVFNWSNYIAPETIPNFERESGARIGYGVYESNEEMLTRVMSGNSGWDVVFPTNYMIKPMREQNLLLRLDQRRLSQLHNLEAAFQAPEWDRDLLWSVPYMWSGTGILCRPETPVSITGWSDLWQSALAGRITMLDDPVDVFAACLRKIGLSLNTQRAEDLRRAQGEALRQKRLVRAYLNAEVRDQVVAGDVLAAQLWSTTAQQAIVEAPQLHFVFPREGFPLYADNSVILRESSQPELAHEFLNYLLRPAVAARIAEVSLTATANAAARASLPSAHRENPALYPSGEVLARGEWAQTALPETQRLRDRLWTEIKAA